MQESAWHIHRQGGARGGEAAVGSRVESGTRLCSKYVLSNPVSVQMGERLIVERGCNISIAAALRPPLCTLHNRAVSAVSVELVTAQLA